MAGPPRDQTSALGAHGSLHLHEPVDGFAEQGARALSFAFRHRDLPEDEDGQGKGQPP